MMMLCGEGIERERREGVDDQYSLASEFGNFGTLRHLYREDFFTYLTRSYIFCVLSACENLPIEFLLPKVGC